MHRRLIINIVDGIVKSVDIVLAHRCAAAPPLRVVIFDREDKSKGTKLKWYLRKYADGKLETLHRFKGLERDNFSLTLIRKYCRLVTSNNYAYLDSKDIKLLSKWCWINTLIQT